MSLYRNLRQTLRVLGKNPGFLCVAVLSLALAIGANTAIFSLLNALLLRDLPVPHPESLVELSVVRRGRQNHVLVSHVPGDRAWAKGFFRPDRLELRGSSTNLEINGVLSQADLRSVSGNYLSELGATPLLGKLISPDDVNLAGTTATSPVAVLSYEYLAASLRWRRGCGRQRDRD